MQLLPCEVEDWWCLFLILFSLHEAFSQRADRLEVCGTVLNCYDSVGIPKAMLLLLLRAVHCPCQQGGIFGYCWWRSAQQYYCLWSFKIAINCAWRRQDWWNTEPCCWKDMYQLLMHFASVNWSILLNNLVWVLVRYDLNQCWSSWDRRVNSRNLSVASFMCELICVPMNKQNGRTTWRVANGDLTQTNEWFTTHSTSNI